MKPEHYPHAFIGHSFVWCEWKGDIGKLENNRCEHCKWLIRSYRESSSVANSATVSGCDSGFTSPDDVARDSVAGPESSAKAQSRPDRINAGTG